MTSRANTQNSKTSSKKSASSERFELNDVQNKSQNLEEIDLTEQGYSTLADEIDKPMTGARALVAALEDEGVEVIFGYPGGAVLDIYDSLMDSKKIRHILVRHEQAAVHAAEGYARQKDTPGVVLITSGPGSTNAVTGITNAYMDSTPLVVIAGQVATSSIGTDAFQEADFLGITLPITKHSYLVTDIDNLVPAVHEAFHIASTGRRGPVVICVPNDISSAKTTYVKHVKKVSIPSYRPTYKGNARQIRQAASLICESARPVILSGGGVVAAHAETDLKNLAEILQIPVAHTLMGRSSFPQEHYLSLGQVGMHGMPAANTAIMNCDLLVAVGTRFSNRVTGKVSEFAPHAKIIHIDIDPAEIGKNVRVDLPIVGDAHAVLSELFSQIQTIEPETKSITWLERIDSWKTNLTIVDPENDPEIINAHEIFEQLNEITKDLDVIFTTEVGEHQMWAAQMLNDRGRATFITSGGAGTMGFGFPAAIGAQIVNPDKLVICLAGDGSIQMNLQEMATVSELGLPIKVIVFDNAALGMVRQLQEVYHKRRYIATDLPRIPNYELLAKAYGWQGISVSDPKDLHEALDKTINAEGPALLAIQMSRVELALPMVRNGQSLLHMIGVADLSKNSAI